MNKKNIIKIISEYENLKDLDASLNRKLDILFKYVTNRIYQNNYTIKERLFALKLMEDLMENHKE